MLRHLRMTEIANEVKLQLFYFADWMMPCSGCAAARVSYNRGNTNLFISGWDPEGEFCRRVAGIGWASNLDLSVVRSDLVRTNQRHLCRGNWKSKRCYFTCAVKMQKQFSLPRKKVQKKKCVPCVASANYFAKVEIFCFRNFLQKVQNNFSN